MVVERARLIARTEPGLLKATKKPPILYRRFLSGLLFVFVGRLNNAFFLKGTEGGSRNVRLDFFTVDD